MSSTLSGTMLTWVCGHECFRGSTGINSLFLETFGIPFTWDLVSPAASLCTWESSPEACVLKLLLYLADGEEKVLLHGISFSKTKPIKRHTSHMEEVCFYYYLPANLAAHSDSSTCPGGLCSFCSDLSCSLPGSLIFGIHPLGYSSGLDSNFSKARNELLQVPADPGGSQDGGKLPSQAGEVCKTRCSKP